MASFTAVISLKPALFYRFKTLNYGRKHRTSLQSTKIFLNTTTPFILS